MRSDQLISSTHPLSTVIEKANEVHEIFDVISYSKVVSIYAFRLLLIKYCKCVYREQQ